MKNVFTGVLRENKADVEMGKKKNKFSVIPEICNRECNSLFTNRTSPIKTLGDDNKGVENPRQKPSGMTLCDSGFTLIELLVVVLIIGILAAVALPQYQVAVLKARATELIQLVSSIKKLEEAHYLATGSYTTFLEDLDVEFAAEKQNDSGSPIIYQTPKGIEIQLYSSGFVISAIPNEVGFLLYYKYSTASDSYRDKMLCIAKTDTAKKVCGTLGGVLQTSSYACSYVGGSDSNCYMYAI